MSFGASGQVFDLAVRNADSIIISRIGLANFESWVTLNPQPNFPAYIKTDFTLMYWVVIPEMPGTAIDINMNKRGEFSTDPKGQFNRGIPNCQSDSSLCIYIKEADVKKIAEVEGLEKGVTEWKYEFKWIAGPLPYYRNKYIIPDEQKIEALLDGHYTWEVSNTLKEDKCKSNGITMTINANTGEVTGQGEWSSVGVFVLGEPCD